MTSLHFHALTVSHIQPTADDALVVYFNVPADLRAAFEFAPGQHLTLRTRLGGEELRRSYSICAAAGEGLRVGVRRVPGGAFSSWLHSTLKPGDLIDVMPPDGRFGAALAGVPRHLLLVAGGSGITPLLSILKTSLARDTRSRCTLVYGNRDAASMMFKEELEELKNRYLSRLTLHLVFSREGTDSALHSGRINGQKMGDFLRLSGPVDDVFVCGPHAMNDEVEAALLAQGLAPAQIHIERFGLAPGVSGANTAPLHAAQAGDATQARITIVRDGLRREVVFAKADESILAAAARTGMDLPFSCKSGVCATCRAKVLQGQVRMGRNFALQADEVAAGFVLSCQAHPLSERVVLSFDER
jgi:ring-1,2-phenylacetyl-CoA epoxidase subunit PaaE